MIPTVMGGILGKSTNATSAPSWWNTVADLFDGYDDDDLSLIMLGNTMLANAGKGLLGSLFGGNLESIMGSLAGASGLGKEKSGKLLTTIAPMVIGFLSRWARKKGLTFGSLTGKLFADRSAIVGALPAGIDAALLGFSDKPGEILDDTDGRMSNARTTQPKFNCTWLLLLLGALILLWLLFWRGCNRTSEKVKEQASPIDQPVDGFIHLFPVPSCNSCQHPPHGFC